MTPVCASLTQPGPEDTHHHLTLRAANFRSYRHHFSTNERVRGQHNTNKTLKLTTSWWPELALKEQTHVDPKVHHLWRQVPDLRAKLLGEDTNYEI